MKIGVVIGRFQTPWLSKGHEGLIVRVKEVCSKLVIMVGVSPIDQRCAENPLSWEQRRTLIENRLMGDANTLVVPVYDKRTDTEWSQQVDTILEGLYPFEDVRLYAGRDSGFVKAYNGRYPITVFVVTEPDALVSATSIRQSIKVQTDNIAFLCGQIYALNRQYPHTYPTVDVAHIRFTASVEANPGKWWEVVLIQRKDTGVWCFPGGFVDPTDRSLEAAAKRELMEETGLASEDTVEYIGSFLSADWRYRSSRDKIMTTFFVSNHTFGFPKAGDDAKDAKWVTLADAESIVSDNHKPLLHALGMHLQEPQEQEP